MNQNILLVIATGVGIAVGSGATYFLTPEPVPQVRGPTQDEISAIVQKNPSLVPPPPRPSAPTEAEALAAYRTAYAKNPMVDRGAENQVTIELGECDKSSSGPGVSCLTSIKYTPTAKPLHRVIGYAKSASGDWFATGY